MTRPRHALALAVYAVVFALLYVGSCIADLPRPGDWFAARRVRAEQRARHLTDAEETRRPPAVVDADVL